MEGGSGSKNGVRPVLPGWSTYPLGTGGCGAGSVAWNGFADAFIELNRDTKDGSSIEKSNCSTACWLTPEGHEGLL